jgi:hypothetical protein
MYTSSLEARVYFFACNFLWDALSLFHYLDEEIAEENIGLLYLEKWSEPFADLINWALEGRFYPFEQEQLSRGEKDLWLAEADTFGESLAIHFGNALSKAATDGSRKHTILSESMWLYHCYCKFIQQVLTEFGQILQQYSSSSRYYEYYNEHTTLFQEMAAAMERERPFLDNVDEATIQAVWEEIETTAARLGTEWRQAVLEAARHQRLPDFISPK